jgi:hypothetical protein
MSANEHPVDDALVDISRARTSMIRLFMRDGELCGEERTILTLIDISHAAISRDRAIERATDYLTRTPEARVNWYGKRLMTEAGLQLVKGGENKVVPLFPEHDTAG